MSTEEQYNYVRAVSGSQRWPICCVLYQHPKGLSVKELMTKLLPGKSMSRVSHQLMVLRQNLVVVSERRGKEMVYTLNDRKRVGSVLNV